VPSTPRDTPDAAFDPRDPRWKDCRVGCRPAAGMHRADCPHTREQNVLRVLATMIGGPLGRRTP
jgi:hypothetical protein